MYKVESAEKIAESIFEQFKNGIKNDCGERSSDYFSVVTDTDTGDIICISVTEETNGIPEEEQFFSIHVIDNIQDLYCDLVTTDNTKKETLIRAIEQIIISHIS